MALTCRKCSPRAGRVRRVLRGCPGALVGLLGMAMLVLLGAAPASAHAQLVSSTPAEGAVVETAPEAVDLEFNERVQVHAEDTRIFAGDGSEIPAEAVSRDRVVTVTPSEALPEGTVVVSYAITSADGHRINGSVTFAVGEPTPGAASSEVFEEPVTAGVGAALTVATGVAAVCALALAAISILSGIGIRRTAGALPGIDRIREVCWPVGLVAAVVAVPLGVVQRGEFGWSGLLTWSHWLDGFWTWRGLWVFVALACAAVAMAALRRTSTGVAVVAALALILAGGASLAAPGADPVPVGGVPAGDPVGEVNAGEHTVRVSFDSLMVGTTAVTVEVLDASGEMVEPFAPPKLSLHSEEVVLGDVVLAEESAGTYTGRVTFPEPGEWTSEVSVRIDEFTNPVLELPFEVGRLPTTEGVGGH